MTLLSYEETLKTDENILGKKLNIEAKRLLMEYSKLGGYTTLMKIRAMINCMKSQIGIQIECWVPNVKSNSMKERIAIAQKKLSIIALQESRLQMLDTYTEKELLVV